MMLTPCSSQSAEQARGMFPYSQTAILLNPLTIDMILLTVKYNTTKDTNLKYRMRRMWAHLFAGLLRLGFPAFGADFSFSSCPVRCLPSSGVGPCSVSSRSPSTRTRTTTPPPPLPPPPSNDSAPLSSALPWKSQAKMMSLCARKVY